PAVPLPRFAGEERRLRGRVSSTATRGRGTTRSVVEGAVTSTYEAMRRQSYPRPLHLRYNSPIAAPKRDHDEWLVRRDGCAPGVVPGRDRADRWGATCYDPQLRTT